MHATKRQAEILDIVRSKGACSIIKLAEALDVSGETIRRDIKPLVSKGLVRKVHGGVILSDPVEEPLFQRRMLANRGAKQKIADCLARKITSGDSLMMDTGSTTAYAALAMRDHSTLFVVTNSVEIARILATRNDNRVMMAGGELRADDGAAFGTAANDFVSQFDVKYAVLSIGAISLSGGFMDYHLCEAEFSRSVMKQAEYTIVIADVSKFGEKGLIKVCELDQVDLLITDITPPTAYVDRLTEAGVKLQIADLSLASDEQVFERVTPLH